MTESDAVSLRAFITWAHRHRDWSTAETDEWRSKVHGLADALITHGIDAEIDLWHESSTQVDWTRWGQQQVARDGFILVALNRAWTERWQGSNAATEGAGVVAEADAMKGLFQQNQADFRKRTILVQLPGEHESRIPLDLHGVTRCRVSSFGADGLEELLRLLTGQPRYLRPPLGSTPILPPRHPPKIDQPENNAASESYLSCQGSDRERVLAQASGTGDDVVSVPVDEAQRGRWLLLRVEGNPAERHFAVKGGPRGRALVSTTDRYRGSILVEPSSHSSLDLEITADGPWSFEMCDALTGARLLEGSLAGVGDDVLRWNGDRTALEFKGNAVGRHFALVAHMGGRRKGLINTTDPYAGRVLLPEGRALLSVLATGPWQCSVDD